MNRLRYILLGLLCAAGSLFAEDVAPAPSESTITESQANTSIHEGDLVVVPLDGEVSEAQFIFLRRILKDAESQGAAAFIIKMDTPGGRLDAAVKILNLLLDAQIPTYTYIDSNAGSAGALIALATDYIYMAPVSAIGAAAPVMSGGKDAPETMNLKIISYYSAYFRSAAEANGYNPDIAEAFINKDAGVTIGFEEINKKGDLLTLSAQEAVKEYDGKPLLAVGIADSVEDLAKKAGFADSSIVMIEPSGFERLALIITTLAPLFLIGGIVGAYIEFKAPGFGVAGFISGLCFLLFFAGHFIAGLTGFEVAVVFAIGLLFLVLEVFLFPGTFVAALIGLALMMGALLFAMVDYWPSREILPSFESFVPGMLNLAIAGSAGILLASLIARYFPTLPLFNRIYLGATSAGTAVRVSRSENSLNAEPSSVEIGSLGRSLTALHPSGRAEFDKQPFDVVTQGDFIEKGQPVKILQKSGGQIIVGQAG
ncbi:MAG: NfeD family protein [Chthoniobacterales bacterium]